jgi:hypothetical protein
MDIIGLSMGIEEARTLLDDGLSLGRENRLGLWSLSIGREEARTLRDFLSGD